LQPGDLGWLAVLFDHDRGAGRPGQQPHAVHGFEHQPKAVAHRARRGEAPLQRGPMQIVQRDAPAPVLDAHLDRVVLVRKYPAGATAAMHHSVHGRLADGRNQVTQAL
jgi:hypothetical protein